MARFALSPPHVIISALPLTRLPPMAVISQTGQTAQDAAQWLRWADQDYLAARNLLLHGLIVQGCGLATTAVEKYLKTVLLMKGIGFPRGNRGHNVVLLYEKLVSAGVGLGLNLEFLTLLVKAYGLRYADDLKTGFNI